jgi:hypothetical protein
MRLVLNTDRQIRPRMSAVLGRISIPTHGCGGSGYAGHKRPTGTNLILVNLPVKRNYYSPSDDAIPTDDALLMCMYPLPRKQQSQTAICGITANSNAHNAWGYGFVPKQPRFCRFGKLLPVSKNCRGLYQTMTPNKNPGHFSHTTKFACVPLGTDHFKCNRSLLIEKIIPLTQGRI